MKMSQSGISIIVATMKIIEETMASFEIMSAVYKFATAHNTKSKELKFVNTKV